MYLGINSLNYFTIKTTAPLIACVVCFLVVLLIFKFTFKASRYNPLLYISSAVVVMALYFAFIDIVGLGRYDYFLDGVIYYAKMLFGFIEQVARITSTLLIALASSIVYSFACIAEIGTHFSVRSVLGDISKIFKYKLIGQYIKIISHDIFSSVVRYITAAIENIKIELNVHKFNCVYSC